MELQGALEARKRMNSNGWTKRKDHARMQIAIMRVEVYLSRHLAAKDEDVRAWCRANRDEVGSVVPGNNTGLLVRLFNEPPTAQ